LATGSAQNLPGFKSNWLGFSVGLTHWGIEHFSQLAGYPALNRDVGTWACWLTWRLLHLVKPVQRADIPQPIDTVLRAVGIERQYRRYRILSRRRQMLSDAVLSA
jgi:hypothetical protein